MKKIYFAVAFLLFLFSKTEAQTYYPLLDSVNEWSYTTQNMTTRLHEQTQFAPCFYPIYVPTGSFREYTTTDTLIGSMFYKPVMNSDYPCMAGFIREDTAARKVFFIDNNSPAEHLLYDFSMQPGDTITIQFAASFGDYASGLYTLDSIGTRQILAGTRRSFHLSCHSLPGSLPLEWIESVGNPNDALYPYFSNSIFPNGIFTNCPGIEHDFSQFMICYTHATRIFDDPCAYQAAVNNPFSATVNDSCNYFSVIIGSVEELPGITDASVFPNPVSGKTAISVELTKPAAVSMNIFDASGRKLIETIPAQNLTEGKNLIETDLSALPNGFYLLQIQTETGSIFRKLLVQH